MIDREDLVIIRKEYTSKKRLASGLPNLVRLIVMDKLSSTRWIVINAKLANSVNYFNPDKKHNTFYHKENNPLSVYESVLLSELRTNETLLINVQYPLNLVLTEYQQQKVWKQ